MENINRIIEARLGARKDKHSLRVLSLPDSRLVDFVSNDYLGFARSPALRHDIEQASNYLTDYGNGATGSRLLSGNHAIAEDLEKTIASFHRAESGLLFNSGYDANIGLFSSLSLRGDTFICDELIHASVTDGIQMGQGIRWTFKHNDPESLEQKLKSARGNVFVAVEAVYSMDGDEPPIKEIARLALKYGAALIVDEAHATGTIGDMGRGLICEQQLEDVVFCRVITFGKALGTHGAIVLGSNTLRSYLVNFARSFIYTTAAPLHAILSVKMAYNFLEQTDFSLIRQKIALFKTLIQSAGLPFIPSRSPIHSLVIGGNRATKKISQALKDSGFDVRPILGPTVPEGQERLRICLHTFNSDQDIINLVSSLKSVL